MAFDLRQIIRPELVRVPLEGATKRETIDELCDLICTTDAITDADGFRRAIWDREGQRSTGIGEGLAIPHGKCPGVKEILMAVGLPKEPIEFDSIDGQPVRMIVLLASPANRIADHIQALRPGQVRGQRRTALGGERIDDGAADALRVCRAGDQGQLACQ